MKSQIHANTLICENQNSNKGGYPKWRERETQPLAKKAAMKIGQNCEGN